ncbi:MAG: helix-turn-helix domain-containing protein [Polyangiaceae bacterium]|nr:helix-turn-helix domain-containing protein [Polyangiaceae bacterium]
MREPDDDRACDARETTTRFELELGILERRAAIAVPHDVRTIEGPELRDARRVLGLKQAELAHLLDVAPETVSRWETGAQAFDRSVQLAALAMLEHVHRGDPVESFAPSEQPKGFQLRIAC